MVTLAPKGGLFEMPRDVFISYRKPDQVAANQMCSLLERDGISCWIASRDLPPGQEWPTAIARAVRRCHSLVLLLSANSQNSRQIALEIKIADKHELPIFTFRLEEVEPPASLEYYLTNLQWIDGFGGGFEASIKALGEAI